MAELNDSLTFKHGATIANRFVQPPMLTNSGIEGEASSDTINYYKHHSKSGGMIITEYIYVSPEGGPAISWAKDRTQLAVYDDKFIPQLKKVAAAMKSSGNKAIMQIADTGREASGRVALYGKPVYAPSAMDFPFLPYKVHEYSDEQIQKVVRDFGDAVKRAVEAGFDGIEIHGANHYLIQQFFSAYSNHRTDHWGGNLEKRMNFPLAVVESVMNAVKKYALKDFIVGHRDFHDGYVSFTENLVADSFLIELDYEMANQNLTDSDEPVGERLYDYDDIVNVTLYFENGTSETINLPWLELRRDENDWQSSELRTNRPLNKETLGRMSPDLAKAMQRIEKDDRFMNRKILTVHVNKDK